MDAELIPFGSPAYGILCGVLVVARAMDFLSTWVATPNLRLEANPLARRLGWKWGILLNVVICAAVARWPMVTIMFTTTSLLVAARNFQSAWLMRSLGEERYIHWMSDRIAEAPAGLFLFCLFAQAALFAGVGGALVWYCGNLPVPFAIGAGTVVYAVAVVFYNLLSFWKIRRHARELAAAP
jgi:hypothetical protein